MAMGLLPHRHFFRPATRTWLTWWHAAEQAEEVLSVQVEVFFFDWSTYWRIKSCMTGACWCMNLLQASED